ncbi:MAG: RNA methyltransferase [Treponema sp.]|nr:RNA methyltransferase [Treponema sp.]MCI7565712.1 RNA methyltransferase [Treponema sp.]
MKNTKRNELAVCGFATVKKLEKNHPEKIRRLYFTEEVAPKFGGLCRKLAKNHGIYNQKPAGDLEKLSGTVHHQGVVAMIEAPEIQPLDSDITDSWVENHENAVLLDRIGNANNFGAIVRSAAFFGIKNIVIPLDEAQSSITTSSYRVAEGGMEYVNIYSVRSSARLLEAMQGKMIRIGTSLDAKKKVSDLASLSKGDKGDRPLLVVLGNEENGISDVVKKNCDELVIIPWAGMSDGVEESCIDSLNVAQASSIIFYEMMKK